MIIKNMTLFCLTFCLDKSDLNTNSTIIYVRNTYSGVSFLTRMKQTIKVACDTKGKRIGLIIEDSETEDKVVVAQRSLLGIEITVIFTQQDVLQRDDKKIWMKVIRKEFNLFVKRKRAIIKQKVKAAKMAKASNLTEAESYAYAWGMSAAY